MQQMAGADGEMKEGDVESAVSASETELMKSKMLVRLVLSIAAYCVTSLAVVYFNWWLFRSGFRYPVFISWLQQVVGFGIFLSGSTLAAALAGRRRAARGELIGVAEPPTDTLSKIFPRTLFERRILGKVCPLSVSFVLTIAASNLCLQKVQISTYQVARSLTLLFVLLLSYTILKQSQTRLVLVGCFMMVAGFVINSLDTSTLSAGGVLFGASSSFFQALYNVLIKFTLPSVNNNNQMLLFYNVLLSSFLFMPVVFLCEGLEPFVNSVDTAHYSMLTVWGGILVSGILGTSLNMTQYLLIQTTTPLTFNIIGLVKSLVQSLGGIVFLGDQVTFESTLGITLSTVGSAVYVKAKNDEAARAAAAEQTLFAAKDEDHWTEPAPPATKEDVVEMNTPSTVHATAPRVI